MNVTAAATVPAKKLAPQGIYRNRLTSTTSRALFAVVIFLGAFLLFSVQLLLGKYILPWFGGTAGVWATCLFFFQTTLLAGYAYAHGSVGQFSLRLQTRVHIALLLSSLIAMGMAAYFWPSPITPGNGWKPQSGAIAVWLILRLLLVSVGAAVMLLATTGPLMQHWFTKAFAGESPYRLYALSNAGSLLGLLSYPAFIERWLRLNTQAWLWCAGYAVYALAAIALAARMSNLNKDEPPAQVKAAPSRSATDDSAGLTLNAKLQWFSLSALGSLMLLAISRFITADLAPVPLLWMLPLAVYLLSFIICFDHPRWYRPGLFHPLLLAATVFTLMFYRGLGLHLWIFIVGFLVTEFACCVFCHGELYRRRPQAQYLTSFYLMIALGGVAGSAFVNLVESSLEGFNGGNSVWDFRTTVDGFGRLNYSQQLQNTGGNYDTIETDYDNVGRENRTTMPYSAGGDPGGNNSIAGTNTTYDALGRVLSVTQGTSSSTSYQTTYQYVQNDVLITVGKSGAKQFSKNLEYDGLGRLVSVCEIVTASGVGAGSCQQKNTSATGFLTKYTYDVLGDLTSVSQNAQTGALNGTQTRTYNYDGLGRMTNEINPETGRIVYTWDHLASGMCGPTSQPGELMAKTNADNSQICYVYDKLHRLTDWGGTVCRRFRYDSISNALFSPPANYAAQNLKGHLVEAETDTCGWPPTSQTKITDEWFNWGLRGDIMDEYQSTRNSAGYYHTKAGYLQNYALSSLQLLTPTQGLTPVMGYGLDAEGRVNSVTSSLGQNPVTGVTYSSSSPLGAITKVTLGSGDYDSFSYDSNSGAITQYAATIGSTPQTMSGALTWSPNANGTIQSLTIVDPFNSNDNQTCNYAYDDLNRISQDTCNNPNQPWSQTFTYDAFGNITKTGNDTWTPNYNNPSNNQYLSGWYGASYDGNGRLTNDTMNSYTWDTWGDLLSATPVGGNTSTLTYDAFGRMVESTNSAGTQQYLYSTTGGPPLATAHAQILNGVYLPLPGGAIAMIGSTGPWQYNHPDWLGSARIFSSTTRVATPGFAYAPFGEGYAQSANQWIQFTNAGNAWTVGGNNNQGGAIDDFMYRRYNPGQGRWISPDPVGLEAVDPTNPQAWNRYAYVANNPLSFVDPLGLRDCLAIDGTVKHNCPEAPDGPDFPADGESDDDGSSISQMLCKMWGCGPHFPMPYQLLSLLNEIHMPKLTANRSKPTPWQQQCVNDAYGSYIQSMQGVNQKYATGWKLASLGALGAGFINDAGVKGMSIPVRVGKANAGLLNVWNIVGAMAVYTLGSAATEEGTERRAVADQYQQAVSQCMQPVALVPSH